MLSLAPSSSSFSTATSPIADEAENIARVSAHRILSIFDNHGASDYIGEVSLPVGWSSSSLTTRAYLSVLSCSHSVSFVAHEHNRALCPDLCGGGEG